MYLINLSQDYSKLSPYLSSTLLKKIEENLDKGKKIILYLNKRGEFSSFICKDCGHIYKCRYCDISMSVHKYPPKLICHFCSHKRDLDLRCEQCSGTNLEKIGIGTQQIESLLNSHFGKNRKLNIYRFDTDNVKTKKDKEFALANLQSSDIIIGTKMITTGFDFEAVGLIGVILVEQELQIAKYNTEEKVFQNIKQLIGRGNRKGENSEILLQSFVPENESVKSIAESNYKDFFIKTISERELFNYPPYSELIIIEYRHSKSEKAYDFLSNIKNKLEYIKTNNKEFEKVEIIMSPETIKRRNSYYSKVILKGAKLRKLTDSIRAEILRNRGLTIKFE